MSPRRGVKGVFVGALIYGNPTWRIEFDDRVLAHLQIAVMTKIRRNEGFQMSWSNDHASTGRTSIWMHPSIPLMFQFNGSRDASINRSWIDLLLQSASSSGGLQVIPEPRDDDPRHR